jgi:hypothetical protein
MDLMRTLLLLLLLLLLLVDDPMSGFIVRVSHQRADLFSPFYPVVLCHVHK